MFLPPSRAALEKARARESAEGETSCVFVGSKGLMKLCETRRSGPNDASEKWRARGLRGHRQGGRIYVHAPALGAFARHALPRIDSPFTLVTGDSIFDVSPEVLGANTVQAVLDHPMLQHWHVQNLAFDHPKVSLMPLGMDYHTMSRNRRPDWGPSASARAQEDLLHAIRALGRPLAERRVQGYCNWHFVLGNGDREQVIEALPDAACHYEPQRVERAESWRRNAGFAFTISPRGRGMDCHRTWEAILLGSIPLIPDLPINGLFADLPVVVVRDWATVTPDFLAAEQERILASEFDFAPLLLEFWRRRLHGETDLPALRMGYQGFMAMGPAELRAALG